MPYLDVKELGRWMKSALKTLESAKKDLEFEYHNWACFKAHQAVEKALKAVLIGVGRPRADHSLTYLLRYLSEVVGEKPSLSTPFWEFLSPPGLGAALPLPRQA